MKKIHAKDCKINCIHARVRCSCECNCDGYHTFDELYEHRNLLFLLLLKKTKYSAYKSKLHADGTMFEGMFWVGIPFGDGILDYHLPLKYWDICDANDFYISSAPVWDGHTSQDVLRLLEKKVCEKI